MECAIATRTHVKTIMFLLYHLRCVFSIFFSFFHFDFYVKIVSWKAREKKHTRTHHIARQSGNCIHFCCCLASYVLSFQYIMLFLRYSHWRRPSKYEFQFYLKISISSSFKWETKATCVNLVTDHEFRRKAKIFSFRSFIAFSSLRSVRCRITFLISMIEIHSKWIEIYAISIMTTNSTQKGFIFHHLNWKCSHTSTE